MNDRSGDGTGKVLQSR